MKGNKILREFKVWDENGLPEKTGKYKRDENKIGRNGKKIVCKIALRFRGQQI